MNSPYAPSGAPALLRNRLHGLNIHLSGADAPSNVAQPVAATPCRPGGEALHTGTQQRAGGKPKGRSMPPHTGVTHGPGSATVHTNALHQRGSKKPTGWAVGLGWRWVQGWLNIQLHQCGGELVTP